MLFAKFGIKPTPISVAEFMVKCPCCETDNWADIMIISNYYHFYFVPIFPIGKEANIVCKKCGLRRYGIPFNSKLISDYNTVKKLFPHPWFTYIGIGIPIIIFLIVIISAIFTGA
ncbi:MAG: hypothetical protein V4556_05750 [Bacteroidota bacterium]